jgi:hypothetical protein
MGLLWDFYWPVVTAGMVAGLCAGWIAFKRNRRVILAAGALATIVMALLWHFAGTGDRFAGRIDARAKTLLVDFEMQAVSVDVDRRPLRRQVTLAGPADDYQRGELARLMELLPGISKAHWERDRSPLPLPVMIEACLLSLFGFSLGLLLAYLVDLRRRANSHWRW